MLWQGRRAGRGVMLALLIVLVSLVPVEGARAQAAAPGGITTTRRVVALTFDDGPSTYTPHILATLRELHVPATFFVIGLQVRQYPGLVRAEVDQGDEIGDHTFNHLDLRLLSDAGIRAQIQETQRAVWVAARVTPRWLRPPDGDVDARVAGVASALGLRTVLWDVDPRDWARPGVGVIVGQVLAQVHPGSVILLHDGGGDRSETVAALPLIVRALRARGYRFLTLSALFGLPSGAPPIPAVEATRTVSGSVSGPAPPAPVDLLTADFVSRSHGFLAVERGDSCPTTTCHPSLLATTDGGQSWRPVSFGIGFRELSFVSPEHGYGVTLGGALLRTRDGGHHWSALAIPAAASWVGFAASGHGWLVAGPALYRTGSGGRRWRELPFRCGYFQRVARVSFVNRRTGFLLCRQGNGPFAVTLYRSDDAGTSWRRVSLVDGTAHALGAFDFLSPQLGFVSAGFGNLLRTADGGHIFRQVPGTPFEDVQAASWLGPDTGYVASYTALMRTVNGGVRWQQIYPAVKPRGPIALTASGAGIGTSLNWFPGAILRTGNGLDWRQVTVLPATSLAGLVRTSSQTVWAVAPIQGSAFRVQLFRSADGGTRWRRVLSVPGGNGFLSFAGPRLGFLATTTPFRLYVTAHGGRTWSARSESVHTWNDQFVSATAGWAFGPDSTVVHTDDGGRHWQRVAVRVPNLRPGDLYFLNPRDGWISGTVCPSAGHCVPVLLRTQDGGAHWLLIRFPPGFASTGFDWVGPELGYVLSNGVLYRTRDGGTSWQSES